MKRAFTYKLLESIYEKYNRRKFLHPDPLEFLYRYPDPADREIVGLVCSSLAYGSVKQILKSIEKVLEQMGNPTQFVTGTTSDKLLKTFSGFKYRWTKPEDLAGLLVGMKDVLSRYGSLENCLVSGSRVDDSNILAGLDFLVSELQSKSGTTLLAAPGKGSACKRLFLFLRWMVRKDRIDPGGWKSISPETLIIPLDIHHFRIAREFGLTSRKQANLKTAIEITKGYSRFSPKDPVKYDFALTRFGIRDELDIEDLMML